MEPIETRLAAEVGRAVDGVLGRPWPGTPPVEVSNRPELGDYASPVAFQLAKVAGRAPLDIARDLADHLSTAAPKLIARAEASPPAFVNLRLAPETLREVVASALEEGGAIADTSTGSGVKVVVEHTNVNPNKAAHVGHFRNACIGDSVARTLARLGHTVEVQNYIDDTGVQVADLVVGLRELGLEQLPDEPYDRYCSRVYAAVKSAYDERPALVERRLEVRRAVESGSGDLADYARDVAGAVAECNLATMSRAGIEYDLLTWESDILRAGLWEHTFRRLKSTGAVHKEEDGPNAGTWVLPFGSGVVDTEEGTVAEDKVLVTRDGMATYTAKDLAYQLWKFGLAEHDMTYARYSTQPSGRPLWTTAYGTDADAAASTGFAGADRVINVIDASQSYPQQIVYEALRRLGYAEAAECSEHLAYGFVRLTAAAARAMGVEIEGDGGQVTMKGRAGVQVFADDLLDRLADLAREKTNQGRAAEAVAAGAARYYMLKFSNNQEIAFDFDDALRTTGESGMYLQYAYVRASGILRKVTAPESAPDMPDAATDHDRHLVLKIADYPRVLTVAGAERNIMTLAKYGFELASAFSGFYDNTRPIVAEDDEALRAWRGAQVAAFRLVLGDVMDILGLPRLERI